jgi:hypothetical protein
MTCHSATTDSKTGNATGIYARIAYREEHVKRERIRTDNGYSNHDPQNSTQRRCCQQHDEQDAFMPYIATAMSELTLRASQRQL